MSADGDGDLKNNLLFNPTVGAILSGGNPGTPKKMDLILSSSVYYWRRRKQQGKECG